MSSSTPEITIYSTAVCPYCVAAKNFLKSKGQAWTEVRIDLDPAEREKNRAFAMDDPPRQGGLGLKRLKSQPSGA